MRSSFLLAACLLTSVASILRAEDEIGLLETDGADGGGAIVAASNTVYTTEQTLLQFLQSEAAQTRAGRKLVDIEVRWTGTAERITAVWRPMPGTIHRLVQGTPAQWEKFFTRMGPLNGRFLDVEVGYFGGDKK